MKLLKFFPLVKVDESTHTISGIATAEAPDKDGEICDYDYAKTYSYPNWSNEAAESTKAAGQEVSYGNIRLQHTLEIAGKAIAPPAFVDNAKEIHIQTQPENDSIWNKAKKGFVRGFSQGGDYAWRICEVEFQKLRAAGETLKDAWKKATHIDEGNACPSCKKNVLVRYGPVISEVSYVDNPALKLATFTLVKADGSQELCKFVEGAAPVTAVQECCGNCGCPLQLCTCAMVEGDELSKKAKGVKFVIGFKEGGGSEVQSVIFDKDKFTQDEAKAWLKENDLTSSKVDETENSYRYRQSDPGKYARFRTITPGQNKKAAGTERSSMDETTKTAVEKAVKYLVTEKDGTTHLPYTGEDGSPDHRLMGAAWAALHGGYRGNKYEGPDKSGAIKRLKSVYEKEKMDTPDKKAAKTVAAAVERTSGLKRTASHLGNALLKAIHQYGEYQAFSGLLYFGELLKSKSTPADGPKLHKGMYEVARLANMLCDLAWMRICVGNEQESEGDDSSLPEDLQTDLESLAETFIAMAQEETDELTASAAEGKGQMYMAETNGALAKARKSIADHIGAAKASHAAHLTKMHKAHQDFHDEMAGHMDKMYKAIGVDETFSVSGGDPSSEPTSIDPQSQGTGGSMKATETTFTKADVERMITEAVEKAKKAAAPQQQAAAGAPETFTRSQVEQMINEAVTKATKPAEPEALTKTAVEQMIGDAFGELVKALSGVSDDESVSGVSDDESISGDGKKKKNAAAAATGIGNRDEAVVKANVRVMPVTKEQDSQPANRAVNNTDSNDPALLHKAMTGDVTAQLEFMKGTKAQSAIPNTLSDVLKVGG